MKYTLIVIFALAVAACNKTQNCDLDGLSVEYRYNTQVCNDGPAKYAVDTVATHFETICDCENYCEQINRAWDNTIAIYENKIANAKSEDEKNQAIHDRDQLINTKPNCGCQ